MSNDFCPRCGLDIEKGRCSNCGYNAKTGQMEQKKLKKYEQAPEPVKKPKKQKPARVKTEAGNLNPFFTIFFKMRASMRYIIDSEAYGGWTIFGMVFLNGFFTNFSNLSTIHKYPMFTGNPESVLLPFIILNGIGCFMGAAISLWIIPPVLNIIFGIVGGNGNSRATKLAFGWSNYPGLIFGLILMPLHLQMFVSGEEIFSGMDPVTIITSSLGLCIFALFFAIYSVFYSIKLYAEAQEFSFWQALIGLMIAMLIPIALGICAIVAAITLATTAG